MAKNGNGPKVEEVIKSIHEAKGYVCKAADLLSVSRKTFYNYLKKFATAQQALDDVREKRHDKVELALQNAIDEGNITAIIFYLKTQCKSRGYVERQEITGVDAGPVTLKVVYEE
jgi:hypothetical protein